MKRLLALVLIICASFSLNAQEIAKKRQDDKLPTDPKVSLGVLDNGIRYFIRENKKPENRAELRIVIKAGSVQEDDDQKGLAHFIEHMCFNGTKNFPKDQLVKFLESTGIRFGADLNANTGFDRTYYLLTIPLDKPGLLEQGFQVLEDWAHNVSFDNAEIEKERGVILEEWRLYRGAQERIQKIHLPVMLKGSKFADRLPIGEPEIIKNAPKETFLRFYNEWYRPDLMAVIAVGDFKKEEVENLIKKHFAGIKAPEKFRQREEYPIPSHKEPLISIAKDKELPMPNVAVFYKLPGREENTFGGYRAGIVDRLIATMISMRMMELTQKPEPPYLYAGAGADGFLAGLRAFNVVSVTKTDNILKGFDAAFTEAYRAYKFGFTKGELDRAKKEIMRGMESALAEKDKTESAAYAEEYYRAFYENEGFPGIDYEVEIHQTYLPTVTLDEVNATMKSYMPDENMVVTLSAPDKDGVKVPTEQELLAVINGVKSKDLKPYEDVSTDKPLLAKKPKPGKIVSEKKTPNFDIVEMTLSNGAKVLVKQTDFKNDEVLFKAWSNGGTSLADNKLAKTAEMADAIIENAGLGEFDITTLQKMMTGKVCGVSPFISEFQEGFDGSASPQDLETFFELLYSYFTNPRKDDAAFKSFMTKQMEAFRNSKRAPESALQDTLMATLYNYHPRFMPTTENDLKSIDLNKAFEFYKQRFANAGDFTFAFVGSFDMPKLRSFIETYIASLPATKEKESWKDLGYNFIQGKVSKEVKKGIEPKSTVRLTMNGKMDYKPEELIAFNAMMEIFNIRLREVIREEKGGVYGIGARQRVSKYPSPRYSVSIGFGTAPERVQELIKSVNDVIDEMKAKPAEKENLVKAQEIMKREFEKSQKQNGFWLNAIYTSDFNGLDIARYNNYVKNIEKLDGNKIQEMAKKYLDTKNFLQVVLNPEE